MVRIGKFLWFDYVSITDDIKAYDWPRGSISIDRRVGDGIEFDQLCLGLTLQWCSLLCKRNQAPLDRMASLASRLESAIATQFLHLETMRESEYEIGFTNPKFAEYLTSIAKGSGLAFNDTFGAVSLDTVSDVARLTTVLSSGVIYVVSLSQERGKLNNLSHMIGIVVSENGEASVFLPELGEVLGTRSQLPTIINFYLEKCEDRDVFFETAEPYAVSLAVRTTSWR